MLSSHRCGWSLPHTPGLCSEPQCHSSPAHMSHECTPLLPHLSPGSHSHIRSLRFLLQASCSPSLTSPFSLAVTWSLLYFCHSLVCITHPGTKSFSSLLSPWLLVYSRKLCHYFITYFLTLIFLLFYPYTMTLRLNFQRKGLIFLKDLAFSNSKEICSFEFYCLCYLTE